MTKIVLCRVDSRLIHGQVMTKWIQQSQADHIVIISDSVSKDLFLLDIYKMSAPPGINIDCFNEEQAASLWKADAMKGNILLLLPDLKTLHRSYCNGIHVNKVQIGGLGGGPDRKVVYQNITLDKRDADILNELHEKGVDIIFQTIPEDNPMSFKEAYSRFRK